MRQHTFDVYQGTTKTIRMYQQYDELQIYKIELYVFDFKAIIQ